MDVAVACYAGPHVAWHATSIAGTDTIVIWTPPPELVLELPDDVGVMVTNLEYFVAWDIVGSIMQRTISYTEMEVSEWILIQDVPRVENPLEVGTGAAVAGAPGGFITPMGMRDKEGIPLEPSKVINRKEIDHCFPHFQGFDLFEWNTWETNHTYYAPHIIPWGIYTPCIQNEGSEEHPVKGKAVARVRTQIDHTTLVWPDNSMATSLYWVSCCLEGSSADLYGAAAITCPGGMSCWYCAINVITPMLRPNSGTLIGSWGYPGATEGVFVPRTEVKGEYDVFIIDPEILYEKYGRGVEGAVTFGASTEDGGLSLVFYSLIHSWAEDWEAREYYVRCSVGGDTYEFLFQVDHPYSESERMDFEVSFMECTIYETLGKVWFLFSTLKRQFPWDDGDGEEYFLQYHIITYTYGDGYLHHQSREFQGSLQSEGDYGSVESIDGVTHGGMVPFEYENPDTGAIETRYNPGTFRLVKTTPYSFMSGISGGDPMKGLLY